MYFILQSFITLQKSVTNKIRPKMFDNFVQREYQPYNKIYTHQSSKFSIYLGDVSAALDMDFIKGQPINAVVTAAAGMDHVSYHNNQVNHIVYPLLDAKSQNITKFFLDFYQLVQKHILSGNILVHCAAGISRSATLLIAYIMKKKNWTFKEAVKFVRDKRPVVLPNLGFQRQLKEFQATLKNKSNNRIAYSSEFDKRFNSDKNNEENRILFSPIKRELPEIKFLGQIPLLRKKPSQKTPLIRLEKDQIREIAHKKLTANTRRSEPTTPQALNKKSSKLERLSSLGKDFLVEKIESGRDKLLQKSPRFVYMDFPTEDNTCYEGQIKAKKLSSSSHRNEKRSRESKILRNHSNNSRRDKNVQFHHNDISPVIASKLQLNEKFATEKMMSIRGMQRLALF